MHLALRRGHRFNKLPVDHLTNVRIAATSTFYLHLCVGTGAHAATPFHRVRIFHNRIRF